MDHLFFPLDSPRTHLNCVSKQQISSTIRQMQQFLKGQENRFAEVIRIMKTKLTNLQNSISKANGDEYIVSCPTLEAPANGKKFGTKYLVDHEVHFTCNAGFELIGPNRKVCQENGNWTGDMPFCKDASACASQPCQNGGICSEGNSNYKCTCLQGWTGYNCQHPTPTAPPEWSVMNDPAFSRKPRCAKIDRTHHCSCEPGFHMSGTYDNSICQDVNECEVYKTQVGPRLCMHACINTPGSYHCSCPPGYKLFSDGRSCEDIDECLMALHNCSQETTCINTGGGYYCINPECPKSYGDISYVKTSPFQCERNPCPMNSRTCHLAPKTISFHYLSMPSGLETPITLFRMASASAPGRPGPDSLRFGIVGGNSRGNFVMQRSDRQTGELILVKPLYGPMTAEIEVDMSEYLDRTFQAKHVSKVFIFVSPYNF
ncbi:fibulin-7 isoform X2 [Protopterus annectens]|uniref:fibulin-7 isoform X2 n=1 Tax=Protopterus annectens TaxID=7888 RepID=UPI001CFAE1F7|nr:fibulin-7 isoform X2 [Protopterus annectens]